jgi:lysozyme
MKKQQQNDLYEKGIDVSRWQGEIDWGKVAADGIKHVFIKMSEGGTYIDPQFVTNWNAAKNAGLKVNAYHYFRALSSTPEEQAVNIKKSLLSVGFDSCLNLLAIDVEKRGNDSASQDEMADNLQDLLTQIKRDILPDFSPMIYCSPNYWDSSVGWEKYDFSRYPLWIANWNVEKPQLPKTWDKPGITWSWWQHSSQGRVNGISGDVDLDWIKNLE